MTYQASAERPQRYNDTGESQEPLVESRTEFLLEAKKRERGQ